MHKRRGRLQPDNNQFLLVYSNETNGESGFEIFAQKLNAAGRAQVKQSASPGIRSWQAGQE
jgi:hypothetical protein